MWPILGPMVPSSSGSAGAKVDKESGTCSSVSLVLRYVPPQTARPATSIALRWETLSEQVRQRLPDAPAHRWPTHQAPALIRESGQETAPGGAGHRLLQVQTPPAPQGERIIARETAVPARASVP